MDGISHFVTSGATLLARTGKTAVLFDVQHGQFYSLNQIALRMFQLLVQEQKSLGEVSSLLAQQYNVPKERLSSDLELFTRALISRQLLYEVDHLPPVETSPMDYSWYDKVAWPFEKIEAYLTLQRTEQIFQTHNGLFHLARHFAALPVARTIPATHQGLHRLNQKLDATVPWLPFRASCRHQSAALCWMLRRRGINAHFVIGVYTHPFSAHAWVRSGNEVVQWEAGLSYPDPTYRESLFPIFDSERDAR